MNFNEYRVQESRKIAKPFSTVYFAVKEGMSFAIKEGSGREHDAMIVACARTQMALEHPNIVKVLKIDINQQTGRPFVVMEYVGSPTLQDILSNNAAFPEKGLSTEECLYIFEGAAKAIEYAHSKNIAHGDICAANIFAGKTPKITDFSPAKLSRYFKDSIEISGSALPFIADIDYLAPEQKTEGAFPTKKADIYSLGLCFLDSLSGNRNRFVDFSSKSWPESLKGVISQALSGNPEERQDISLLLSQIEEAKEYCCKKEKGNDKVSRMLMPEDCIKSMVDRGELANAREMIAKSDFPAGRAKSLLLKAALMLRHPLKRALLRYSSFGEIADAVVSFDSSEYERVSKHPRMSNDFAIAAAMHNPIQAIKIFEYLLPLGPKDVIRNNLGAVLAGMSSPKALDCLQKSSLDEAKLNSALFHFSLGDYDNSLKLAKRLTMNPLLQAKAGAILKAVARRKGLSWSERLSSAMSELTARLSEEFAKGIKTAHYEFVRET